MPSARSSFLVGDLGKACLYADNFREMKNRGQRKQAPTVRWFRFLTQTENEYQVVSVRPGRKANCIGTCIKTI
jgi:hypothetical protein